MATTDVCLILEGTYPYVRGGVSSWVHSLIQGLPDVQFSLLTISPATTSASERKFELPANVQVFAEVFIHELTSGAGPRSSDDARAAWDAFTSFHRSRGPARTEAARRLLLTSAMARPGLTAPEALTSHRGWELMVERYQADAPNTSFIDYYWTWRAVHAPLFQTLRSVIPPARVYHPVSTGYAGLLGVIAKLRTGRPLVLTEHGLYVRERTIDIARADWVFEEPVRLRVPRARPSPLKALWIDQFETLARLTYQEADQIVALFEDNRQLQLEMGADPARTLVVPNGVPVEQYTPLLAARRRGGRPPRVGFVGRVVRIKDVKTLLRAFDLVAKAMPDVEFWVVGPTEEDPPYFEECQKLAQMLGLARLRFTGAQDVRNVYPEIDVMVLTSLSEGQPLTLLEAACAGVASVATDVGDCRGLIEGRPGDDQALGPCGIVTAMGSPDETARAILHILGSAELRAQMSKAGVARASRFYRQSHVIDRYRDLYRTLAAHATTPLGTAPARRRRSPEHRSSRARLADA